MRSMVFDKSFRKGVFDQCFDVLSDEASPVLWRKTLFGEKWGDVFCEVKGNTLFLEPFFECVQFESGDGFKRALVKRVKDKGFTDTSEKFRSEDFFEVGEHGMADALELNRHILLTQVFFESDS